MDLTKYVSIVLINLILSTCMKNMPKDETVSKIIFSNKISTPGFGESAKDLAQELDLEFNNPEFQGQWEQALTSEEHIEVKDDGIWTYTTINSEIQQGTLKKVERTNCVSLLYPTGRDGENRPDIPLDKRFNIKLVHLKEDTRIIMGFNCHKVMMELKSNEKNPGGKMEVSMELYVTEEIKIPGNAVINLSSECLEFFPLAIKKEVKTHDRTVIGTTIAKSIE